MRIIIFGLLIIVCAVAIYLSMDFSALIRWTAEQQRWFQNQMAGAVRALRSGETGAYMALLSAAAAYGFVHAVGPGHGKFLIGGVGLGVSVSATRLLVIAVVSSLAQAVWAIILVYGGFYLLEITASQMTTLADDFLAPASYIAIAFIGIYLVWRGTRSLVKRLTPNPVLRPALVQTHNHVDEHFHNPDHPHQHVHDHDHNHSDCGCHAHGPSPEQVASLGSFRDSIMLIGSIAVRPCTSAIFLLVITWSMDILVPGAIAVLVMGLGTALLTSLVAVSSVFARSMAFATAGRFGSISLAIPIVEIAAGSLIIWASILLFGFVVR